MTEWAKQLQAKARKLGLERSLALLFVFLMLVFVIQGLRFLGAALSSRGLADRVRSGATAPERTDRKMLTDYDPILDKGLLGRRDKSSAGPGSGPPINVFGVLGSKALLGATAADAKPFAVGADLPGGEKLIEIGIAEVVLEKDGKKRVAKVFPASSSTPPPAPAVPDARPNAEVPAPQAVAAPVVMPVAPAPAALNAQTLVGTKWQGGGHTVVFNANGALKVDDQIDGTWSVEGNKIKISAAGQNLEVDIQGDTLMFQGQALTRQ